MGEKIEEEEYDYLIIGTGLAETAISSILSMDKNVKIMHIDTNSTYGSEFSTLQYSQLISHFDSNSKDKDYDKLDNPLYTVNNSKTLLKSDDNETIASSLNDNNILRKSNDTLLRSNDILRESNDTSLESNNNEKLDKSNDTSRKSNDTLLRSNDTLFSSNSNDKLDKSNDTLLRSNSNSSVEYSQNSIRQTLLSKSKLFNIDLTPKMLLQDSQMKDFLLQNNIHELVNFTSIKGSFLFTDKLHSIPTNETRALKSSVVSFSQKFKVVNFFWNVRKFAIDNNIPVKSTMLEEFKSFGLSQESIDFIGHAIALNLNDEYLNQHPSFTYEKIVRYVSSIVSYENSESPFLYPLYGLSEICQAFARKSALNGTVFMLRAKIIFDEEHKNNIYGNYTVISLKDPDDKLIRIKTRKIISDPRYWIGSRVCKEIIRSILILPKNTKKNFGNESRNIVFLKENLNRKHDVFCIILGSEECVCPEEYEIGIISTVKETDNPENEIKLILSKFEILEFFVETRKLWINDDTENILFTRSVDESPLFDNIYEDIQRIIEKLK